MNELLYGINAIIFDFGNVIIDLHYERSVKLFSDYSGMDSSAFDDLLVTSDVLQRFEVGSISEDEFRSEMNAILKIQLSNEQFDKAWCALLGEVSVKRLRALEALRTKFKIFVLSNTNSIHERAFNSIMHQNHGIQSLDEVVDRAYLSHHIGLKKPKVESYEYVLNSEGFQPNEVLFIDDRNDNIEGARLAGMRTFWNEVIDDWTILSNKF